MSLPRRIRTLIVEDERDRVADYRAIFSHLEAEFPLAAPECVYSVNAAIERLKSDEVFHLVILDMGLPVDAGELVEDKAVDPGLQVLGVAEKRDAVPVISLLVISGRLQLTNVSSLGDRVKKSFFHGLLVNKGIDIEEHLRKAIREILKYLDVGVLIEDSGLGRFPTLSPREEDLLRRCVLKHSAEGCMLRWWSAKKVVDHSGTSMSKVLLGRFIQEDGEFSHYTFFKFEPESLCQYAQQSANVLQLRLRHINVLGTECLNGRSLLATQCVCEGLPVALDSFLATADDLVAVIPAIVSDIGSQLEQLGKLTEEDVLFSDLLWPFHDLSTLKAAWFRHRPPSTEGVGGPIVFFERLRGHNERLFAKFRAAHGDLHARNVAIGVKGARPEAYIFDPGPTRKVSAVRDLAYLELSVQLFQQPRGVTEEFSILYSDGFIPDIQRLGAVPAHILNVVRFVCELRVLASKVCTPSLYALLVFDSALIELGGVLVQRSSNWVASGQDAAEMAHRTAQWAARLFDNRPHS